MTSIQDAMVRHCGRVLTGPRLEDVFGEIPAGDEAGSFRQNAEGTDFVADPNLPRYQAYLNGHVFLSKVLAIGEHPELLDEAARWFHGKWQVPEDAYRASMKEAPPSSGGVPQWYVLLDRGRIVAGCGVIANDFHRRPDLAPNLCAVHVEPAYRKRGIARSLMDYVCHAQALSGTGTLYLVTDHTDFYERCGWTFHGMVEETGGGRTRMYRRETLLGTLLEAPDPLPGPLLLLESDGALARVAFPGDPVPDHVLADTPLLRRAREQLGDFLAGRRTAFDLPVRLEGTPFQKAVWNALRGIPFGETRTYGAIARAVGSPGACRAVGAAVGANPLAMLVPCHRVLPASGKLGGFRAGPEWKRFLLRLEGNAQP